MAEDQPFKKEKLSKCNPSGKTNPGKPHTR
jgi:hypothetical protein